MSVDESRALPYLGRHAARPSAYVIFSKALQNGGKLRHRENKQACGKVANPSRSKRPYLIRAMHEWMADNGHTPHIVVDASVDGVSVPPEHIKDGKIILNISESAAHNLKLVNDSVSFRARFGGVPFDVWVPTRSILGIYARETGQGMIFSNDSGTSDSLQDQDDVEETRSRPHLRVVK